MLTRCASHTPPKISGYRSRTYLACWPLAEMIQWNHFSTIYPNSLDYGLRFEVIRKHRFLYFSSHSRPIAPAQPVLEILFSQVQKLNFNKQQQFYPVQKSKINDLVVLSAIEVRNISEKSVVFPIFFNEKKNYSYI